MLALGLRSFLASARSTPLWFRRARPFAFDPLWFRCAGSRVFNPLRFPQTGPFAFDPLGPRERGFRAFLCVRSVLASARALLGVGAFVP
ncbi:hypothetical protein GCM10026982_17050 [Nocardiopsis aegyptia]